MAGSIVVNTFEVMNNVVRYRVAWTSDALGDVSGHTFDMQDGTIVLVTFMPGTGGSQPDVSYDADLRDVNNVSVFDNGAGTSIGSNLSNVLSTNTLPLFGLTTITLFRRWHPAGAFQPVIANAGNAKSGTFDVHVYNGIL